MIDRKRCHPSTANVEHFPRLGKLSLSVLFQQLKQVRCSAPSLLARYRTEKKLPRDQATLHLQEFNRLRPLILARDGHRCRKCARQYTRGLARCHPDSLQVHHVNSWRDNRPGHLRTLCLACHIFAPNGRAYFHWEKSEQDRPDIERLRARLIEELRVAELRREALAQQQLFSSPDLYSTLFDLVCAFQKTLDRVRAKARAA
jgi:hypothetical protein